MTFTKYREGSKSLLLSLMISEVYEINMYLTALFISLPDYSPRFFYQIFIILVMMFAHYCVLFLQLLPFFVSFTSRKRTKRNVFFFLFLPYFSSSLFTTTEFGQSRLQEQLTESSQHTHLICFPACCVCRLVSRFLLSLFSPFYKAYFNKHASQFTYFIMPPLQF